MTGLALVGHQFRYDQKTFWRNPASVFFTVMLPLIFLFIFATIFGNETVDERGGGNPLVVSLLVVVLGALTGKLVYDVPFPTRPLPAVLVTLAVGAASFS